MPCTRTAQAVLTQGRHALFPWPNTTPSPSDCSTAAATTSASPPTAIPPNNNGFERDIRMIKLRQKVPGYPPHPHRSQTIPHHPQLPLHHRKTGPTLLRNPRHAHRGPPLDARTQVPFGQPGAVTYGVNVNAAAIVLSSAGNVPVERTAMLWPRCWGLRCRPGSCPVRRGVGAAARSLPGRVVLADAGSDAGGWVPRLPRVRRTGCARCRASR